MIWGGKVGEINEEKVMTAEQVKWAMTQDWYREHQEVGFNITPTYKVRVSDGILKWFTDYNDLLLWVSTMNPSHVPQH